MAIAAFDIGGQQFTDGGGVSIAPREGDVISDIGGFVGGTIGAIGGIVGGIVGGEAVSPGFGDSTQRGPETGGFELAGATGPLELDLDIPGRPSSPLIQPPSINTNEGLARIPVVRDPTTGLIQPVTVTAPGEVAPVTPGPLEQLQNLLRGIGLRTGGPRPTIGAAGSRLVAAQQGRSPLTTILILAAAGGIGYYLWRRYLKGKAQGGGG